MPKLKLILEYDGTKFCGWQSQTGGGSVQDELEKAVEAITGEAVRVEGSGRTDAGAHALAQVASFETDSSVPTDRFPAALNSQLPDGVSVLSCEEVPPDFHARLSAKSKTYRYVIANRRMRPALEAGRSAWVPQPLEFEEMRRAARHFVGRQDFSALATDTEDDIDCVREILYCDLERESAGGELSGGERITITVEGTGFLRKMVRTIAGTLIEVGRGRTAPAEIPRIIASRDRSFAGPTAPAEGLYLVEVKY